VTPKAVLRELERLGTEQTRRTYRRHGVSGDLYGVPYSDLGKLLRKVRAGEDLAEELWKSGNHDARVLATMVADPARMTERTLDAWVAGVDNYVLADAVAAVASRTRFARRKMERWTRSPGEWEGRIGWGILARLAMGDSELTDADYERYLATIEKRIHASKNRVRDAMNMAVIAIGLRGAALEKKAVSAATRIGKVNVDHGDTACKTPDAVEYLRKAKTRRRK
jgi:3-methyladenine DNA glycosylase AlkD